MKQVFVVGTVHAENGLANASELLAILERIQPEVIFLEVPVGKLTEYFKRTDPSLEAIAVRRYSEGRSVALIPVDWSTPPSEFFANDRELNRTIEVRSPEYCRTIDWHSQYTFRHGFYYLNSDYCTTLATEHHEAMLATLRELADPRLDALYQLWLDTNRNREEEMITNVERYCREAPFATGVLVVGAAHRPGLLRVAKERAAAGVSDPRWNFSASLELLATQA